ncbi:ATP-binding protein [Acidiplasma aeolicum]|jgi:predicted AAA+ superfamily ATPase|uniref:ATP-binding protein n=1 Tax=Acidiplasma aeolicum TaxID=507754 RepID=UPI003716C58B
MPINGIINYNTWWETGSVNDIPDYKRPLLHELIKYLDDRQILVIYGLRRTGKTTIMYQLIDYLLKNNINRSNILYFSFDYTNIELKDIIEDYEKYILKKPIKMENNKIYIFLDEVQKLNDWENKIKIYYDMYKNIKFIISGSASINIERNSNESLAGRMYDFILKPLTFKEYLALKNINYDINNIEIYSSKLSYLFNDYLLKGGFPEIVNEDDEIKIKRYINSIIERVALIDIPEEFHIKNIELLKNILNITGDQPGFILNYDSLSKDFNVSKETLINYFYYLEYSLIIKLVLNFRGSFASASRKMKKVYFYNSSFLYNYKNIMDYNYYGKLIENFVMQELDAKYYFKDKSYEIDFILKNDNIIPVEVKYRNNVETKNFIKVLKKLNLNYGIIISKDEFRNEIIDNIKIKILPVWYLPLINIKTLK